MESDRSDGVVRWPKQWTADDIAWVKRQIIAEHERERIRHYRDDCSDPVHAAILKAWYADR